MSITYTARDFMTEAPDDPTFALLLTGLVRRAHDFNAESAEDFDHEPLPSDVLAEVVGRMVREHFRGDSTVVEVSDATFSDTVTVTLTQQ